MLTVLANSWAEAGKNVHVVSIDGTQEDFFKLSASVQHVVLNVTGPSITLFKLNGLYMTVKRIVAIRKAIKNTSPDTVIAFLGETNILVLLATLGIDTRVVISERNDPALQNLGFGWEGLRKFLYRFADIVSANTRGAIDTMRAYVPDSKLVLVPNPIDLENEFEAGNRKQELLAVGSLRHQKAYDVLLTACQTVFEKQPGWRLTIVGDGELWSKLHKLADRLEIGEKVNWVGRVESDPYYKKAQIFVLPSRHEGTPNALLEAMSYSLPVIVSDASPGPLEYVENNTTGLIVPVEDIEALASAILKLITDESLRKKLGNAAADRLEGNRIDHALQEWEHAIGLA